MKLAWVLYIGLVGVASVAWLLWTTPYGPGATADSIRYIGGAEAILSGKGYAFQGRPIAHFPPLYSLVLAANGALFEEVLPAARHLNAALFGVNLGLIAVLVALTTDGSLLAVTLACLFYLSSSPWLLLHAHAWSEPLFITLLLSCILLLSSYVARPSIFLFLASSLCMGLALVTRYAGIALLPAASALIFFLGKSKRIGGRAGHALAWSALASAPLAVLWACNLRASGSATHRSLAYHPLSLSGYCNDFAMTLFDFVAPASIPEGVKRTAVALVSVLLVAVLVAVLKRHWNGPGRISMAAAVALCCLMASLSYFLLLFCSIAFVDATIPVGWRLLSPVLAISIAASFGAVRAFPWKRRGPVLWWCVLGVVALSIASQAAGTMQTATQVRTTGLGFTSRPWRQSETIAFVRSRAKSGKIYTNAPDLLDFLTGERSRQIPVKEFSSSRPNAGFGREIQAMRKEVLKKGAFVVHLKSIKRKGLPTPNDLVSSYHLAVLHDFSDGTVYGKEDRR